MKKSVMFLISLMSLSLLGCASFDKRAVIGLASAGYEAKNTGRVLDDIKSKGFFCQNTFVSNNPNPLFKSYTSDGTFNDFMVYQCMKQSDYFFWMTTTYTYIFSQYGKVISIGKLGTYRTTTYLWETTPPAAKCLTKCLGANGQVE